MPLLALLAGILIWFSFDVRRAMHDKRQWPVLAVALLGLLLLAKGKVLLGAVFVLGVALWGQWPQRKRPAPAPVVEHLNRTEASDLLGVPLDADRDTILAAHRRLIARNHPDNGGTAGIAARLNAARDVLLRDYRD